MHRWSTVDPSFIHGSSIVYPSLIHRWYDLSSRFRVRQLLKGLNPSMKYNFLLQFWMSNLTMCTHFHLYFDIRPGTTISTIFWYVTNHIIIVDASLIYRWSIVDPSLIHRWSIVDLLLLWPVLTYSVQTTVKRLHSLIVIKLLSPIRRKAFVRDIGLAHTQKRKKKKKCQKKPDIH